MPLRWLYHARVVSPGESLDPYAPPSLARESFIHASFADRLAESVRLYLPPDANVRVLRIDPRLVDCDVRIVETPRGPMPHVHGAIPRRAIVADVPLADIGHLLDTIDDA